MSTDNSPSDPFRRDFASGTENPFRENPYLSPTTPGGSPAAYGAPSGRGMVGHVMVVSILMIVQARLERRFTWHSGGRKGRVAAPGMPAMSSDAR